MPDSAYDVIVIGAGPAGENVAGRTAKGGLRTAIVESERVGGECSFWACVPSKALLLPIAALEAARALPGSRAAAAGRIDPAAVLARRNQAVSDWKDDGALKWLSEEHIDLVRGHGRLAGERRVAVTATDGTVTQLTARHAIVMATGSGAMIPPVPGLADANPWTSREATSAPRVPASLAVLGGGVVACEMATAWRGLGAGEVTIIQRGEQLLPGVEPFAGEMVRASLERKGVRVLTGRTAARVSRDARGVHLTLDDGTAITAEELLVATGREPRTRDVGLEHVGLEPGAWLATDDSLRVTAVAGGWLYAVGDVNHRALLTHMGKYQARAAGEAIVARARGEAHRVTAAPWSRFGATADHAAVPQVVFTDPEVAAVGLTEALARKRGMSVRVIDFELGHVTGGWLRAEHLEGKARMVVDEARRVIVGFTLVGPDVGEMIHAATVAVVGEVPLDRLWHAVPSFPTMSEVWLRLLEEYGR